MKRYQAPPTPVAALLSAEETASKLGLVLFARPEKATAAVRPPLSIAVIQDDGERHLRSRITNRRKAGGTVLTQRHRLIGGFSALTAWLRPQRSLPSK